MPTLFKILIEGAIGAGKSTLCEATAAQSSGRAIIMEERIEPTLLKLFYADPSRYAFCFQLHMLESRTNANALQMLRIETEPQNGHVKPSIALLDRCVLGDFVFAVSNYLLGKISDEEMSVYTTRAGGSTITDIVEILERTYGTDDDWKVVYLHSSAANCKQRIDEVRGGVEAGTVPLSYYELIEQIYFNVLRVLRAKARHRTVVNSWNQYQITTHIAARLLHAPNYDEIVDRQPPLTPEPVVQTALVPHSINADRMVKMGVQWFSDTYREVMFWRWSECVGR